MRGMYTTNAHHRKSNQTSGQNGTRWGTRRNDGGGCFEHGWIKSCRLVKEAARSSAPLFFVTRPQNGAKNIYCSNGFFFYIARNVAPPPSLCFPFGRRTGFIPISCVHFYQRGASRVTTAAGAMAGSLSRSSTREWPAGRGKSR